MPLNTHDPEKQQLVTRRATLFGGGVALLFGGIGARLYQLQISDHDIYAKRALENQFNARVIAPLRGEIVDRFGRKLASNRQNFRMLFVPERTRDIDAALDEIAARFDLSDERRGRIKREIRRMGAFTPVQIFDNMSWDEFTRLNYEIPHLPGVQPDVGETRAYPLAEAAAFVVGYVGAVIDRDLIAPENEQDRSLLRQPGFKVGRDGLERTYDKQLRGQAGRMNVKVNAHGRVIEELADEATPAQQGGTLGLTIDAELQQKATEILAQHGEGEDPISGSAVVIDVLTGDVIVMASTPAFDPNAFNIGIDTGYWRELNDSQYKPLLNKPLSATYPPGSTFKLISAIAAQIQGRSPDQKVQCNGKIYYGKRYFHCWKRGGHGPVDMKDALKKSCDVYFYDVAKTMDIDLLAEVARKLGLGETHELGIPGQKGGVVPDRDWKKRYYAGDPANQIWFPGETLSVIIGQGATTSTPLQLAVMAARVATGRQVKPRIVRFRGDLPIPEPTPAPIDINPSYFDVVRAGMDAVTNEYGGTAYRSRLEKPEWRLAGKTGTSQVYRITAAERARGLTKPEQLPWKRRDHALFTCFAPYENPRYACAVVVEHGIGGSRIAGPKARDIMREVFKVDPANKPALDPRVIAREVSAPRITTGRSG
ncbi:MAG: penicillin-binding protein 2 [Pseudomonadota bacterium]